MPSTSTPDLDRPDNSAAWALQTKVSFAVALVAQVLGIVYLPVDPWVRAFLSVSGLYTVTATVSLSKAMRDEHERRRALARDDDARIERLLAERDPYRVVA